MENASQGHKHIVRNIVIFAVLVIALGWLGWLIGKLGGTADSKNLGLLIFIASPLVACIGMRLLGGDGWEDLGLKPQFRDNGLGYALSVLIYPIVISVVLLLGAIFGATTFDFSGDKATAFVPALLVSLVVNFFKNIFEEFGWRGYLTPRLVKVTPTPIMAHLITGAIWGVWHLPYYLGLLSMAEIQLYTSQNLALFILFTIIGMTTASIAFGEIRLLTGSVWSAVVLHAVSNAIILTLLMEKYVLVSPATELLFTPGMHGILSIIIIGVVGLTLYRRRSGETA